METSLSQDFDAEIEESMTQLRVEHITPLRTEIENMPDPVINQITHEHITNVDDRTVQNITNVDDRQVVNTSNVIHGDGDINDNSRNVLSDDGSIAVGGEVEDAALNTGNVDGVQAGGDVDLENSVLGDDNISVLDSDVENLAVGGDANSVNVEQAAAPEPEPAPVIDEPALEEPVIDEPALEEPVIDEPALAEPVLDDSLGDAAFDEAAAAEAEAIESELDV